MQLVGQPFKVLVAFSTAIVQCQCEAKTVLPLHGLGKPTKCPACGNLYAIASSGKIDIGQMISTADAPRVSVS